MTEKDIFTIVISNICKVIPELDGHQFEPNDKLIELGANSVERAEIISLTMESLSLYIPRIELAFAKSIGDLTEVFYAKSPH